MYYMGKPDNPAVLDDYEEYRDINYVREQCKKNCGSVVR